MRKPDTILYWTADKPPWRIALLLAVQQMSFLGVYLVISPLFGRTLQLDHAQSLQLISATLLASAIGVALQAANRFGVGSGFFCPLQVTTSTFSGLAVAKAAGGLGAMFGMVALLGVAQMAFAHLFVRWRSIFTVEIAGLAVMLIGLGLGKNGIQLILETPAAPDAPYRTVLLCVLTLGGMVGANVWFSGQLRLFSAFLGLLAGFVGSWALGAIPAEQWTVLHDVPWFYLPRPMNLGWNLGSHSLVPAIVTGLFLALHGFGAIVAAQRFNDADWKRPDLQRVQQGVIAEGLANVVNSLLNGLPVTSSGGAVSLAAATGCTSRHIAFWLAGVMLGLAFMPKAIVFWDILPEPVVGSALVFLAAFTTLAGLQMVASRLLDNRKILAVGMGLLLGVSYAPLQSQLQQALPDPLEALAFSGVGMGVLGAVLLSALFRIGAHTRRRCSFDALHSSLDDVIVYLEQQGKSWGARAEVVRRAEHATWQAFEILTEHGLVDESSGLIELETLFNEFSFTVVLYYQGSVVPLALHPPSHEALLAGGDGVLQMAGYLLQRLADRVGTRANERRCELRLIFND